MLVDGAVRPGGTVLGDLEDGAIMARGKQASAIGRPRHRAHLSSTISNNTKQCLAAYGGRVRHDVRGGARRRLNDAKRAVMASGGDERPVGRDRAAKDLRVRVNMDNKRQSECGEPQTCARQARLPPETRALRVPIGDGSRQTARQISISTRKSSHTINFIRYSQIAIPFQSAPLESRFPSFWPLSALLSIQYPYTSLP